MVNVAYINQIGNRENKVETLQEKTGKLRIKSLNEVESLDEAGRYSGGIDNKFLDPDGTYKCTLEIETGGPEAIVTFETTIASDKKNAGKDAEMLFLSIVKGMARFVRGTGGSEMRVKKMSNKT